MGNKTMEEFATAMAFINWIWCGVCWYAHNSKAAFVVFVLNIIWLIIIGERGFRSQGGK